MIDVTLSFVAQLLFVYAVAWIFIPLELVALVGIFAAAIWCWDHWRLLITAALAVILPWRQ